MPALTAFADRQALTFLAASYGFSWAVALAAFLTGGLSTPVRQSGWGFAFMLGPALAALVVSRGVPWRERAASFGLSLRVDRWLFAAWAAPLLLVLLATLLSGLSTAATLVSPAEGLTRELSRLGAGAAQLAELERLSPVWLSLGLVFQAAVVGALLNTPLMLSEELGWRGLLWARWSRLGFWPNALATGVVWGLWHAPLIAMGHNYPDAPVLGIGLMVGFCVLLTPALHLVRERGTLLHACLFHGTLNASASLARLCLETEQWPSRGIVGVAGLGLLLISAFVVVLARRWSSATQRA
ncbi:MAG: CPBP family intramembrane metalloprotease [Myxococcus sp.]|nr:CPBP family intramembrane metalloprotease [Myxococcus sp.]